VLFRSRYRVHSLWGAAPGPYRVRPCLGRRHQKVDGSGGTCASGGLLSGSGVAALTTVQGVVAGASRFARPRPGVGVTEAELTGAAHEQCHRTTGEEAPFLGWGMRCGGFAQAGHEAVVLAAASSGTGVFAIPVPVVVGAAGVVRGRGTGAQ